jgi:hypothetical protein
MCLIIADNLNFHSFSLKPVILCKKAILEQNLPLKKISFPSVEDNVNQNMFKQKIFIVFGFIFCLLIIGQ